MGGAFDVVRPGACSSLEKGGIALVRAVIDEFRRASAAIERLEAANVSERHLLSRHPPPANADSQRFSIRARFSFALATLPAKSFWNRSGPIALPKI